MASKDRQITRWANLKNIVPENLKCYVCEYENTISYFNVYKSDDMFNAGELIRYKCPNCEVIFGDLRFLNLTVSEIEKDYEDAYSYYNEGDTTSYILYVFNKIELLHDKQKKYLDYACGKWNNFILSLQKDGYDIIGYDKYVSNDTCDYIFNNLKNKKFDIIINNNYIEHLINPHDTFSELVNLLNDNGYILFISPCFEYIIHHTHYHTFFFSDKSLNILANKFNLSLIYSEKIIFPDNQSTIAKLFKLN